WKISQSSLLQRLFIAPGNPGTAAGGTNLPIDISDFKAVKNACLENDITLLLVGPEQPLVDGIADFFADDEQLKHILVVGRKKAGAQLEGSKAFAKEFMDRHQIPSAAYQSVDKSGLSEAVAFTESLSPAYVLKADGLAGGQGVLISASLEEA